MTRPPRRAGRLSSRSRHRADRSGAERDDEIARLRESRDRRRHVLEPRDHVEHRSRACRTAAASASIVTPGNRRLAGRIDVGEHDDVGQRERGAEVVEQIARARVPVRLEHGDEPRRAPVARRAQHRRNLRRMMAVVVDDRHAARRRRAPGSAARRRGTPRAPATIRSNGTPSSSPTATAASAFCRLCRPGTASVNSPSPVAAGHARARDSARGTGPTCPSVTGSMPAHVRVFRKPVRDRSRRVRRGSSARTGASSTHAIDRAVERHAIGESREGVDEPVERSVRLHVLAIDVRHHGDRRRELEKRSVALVGLDHHVLAAARAARCCRTR